MHPQLQPSKIRVSLVQLALVLCMTALAGCATDSAYQSAPIESRTVDRVEPVESVEDGDQATPLNDAQVNIERAEYYQRLSEQADAEQGIDAALSAAEYYIQANDFFASERASDGLAQQSLTPIQRDRFDVIQAYLAYSRGDFDSAINQLSSLLTFAQPEPMTADGQPRFKSYQRQQLNLSRQQVDGLLLSSFCYQQLGDYGAAIDALLKREAALVGAARAETTRYTWQVINSIAAQERQIIMDSTSNALVRNRLEQSLEGQIGELDVEPQQFTQWRDDQNVAAKQTVDDEWGFSAPKQIAVLLPLSSKFNKASQAVLDGMHYQNEQTPQFNRPQLQVYDIGENPFQAAQYYNAAIQAGADMVIGPLGKDYANQVNLNSNGTIPTILLGGDQALNGNSIRLTMSPEMEGVSVADKALRDGHLTAAVLAPDSSNAKRTVDAFRSKWLQAGGKISQIVSYSPKQFDHSIELKQLFDINQSEYRHRQLSGVLGLTPKFSSYKRSDIDFIFMLASNDTGRIVRPQINFFGGSKIPVYATSSIYNGIQDKVNNMDLERTHFPVMPWVLKSSKVAHYAGQLNELFALGSDAYRMAGNYQQLRNRPDLAINGNTGQLSISSYGEVHHQPVWAQFQSGEAVARQTLGIDLNPIEGTSQDVLNSVNKQGVYNDQNWDTRSSSRKTGAEVPQEEGF